MVRISKNFVRSRSRGATGVVYERRTVTLPPSQETRIYGGFSNLTMGGHGLNFSQCPSVGLVAQQPVQGLAQFRAPIFQIMVAVKFVVMDGCAEGFENLMGVLYADDL